MAVFWVPSPCTLVTHVEKQRARAKSSVVAPIGIAEERIPANCGVPDAGAEVKKSVLPLCGVKPWITSIWWWTDCLPFRSDRKTDECECYEN